MSSYHEHDGTHEAIEQFVRDGIGLAIQLVAHHKRQHQLRQQHALREHSDERLHQLLNSTPARETSKKTAASTRWHGVHSEDWWQRQLGHPNGSAEIVDTYRDALTYTDTDQSARQAVDAMNARFTQAPFNLDINELATAGSPAQLPDEHATDAHGSPPGKPLAQQQADRGDPPIEVDEADHTAMDPRSAETIARLNDLQLSQALTTVGTPLTAADAVNAAHDENEAPGARPERSAPNPGRTLDQGL